MFDLKAGDPYPPFIAKSIYLMREFFLSLLPGYSLLYLFNELFE